MQKKEPRPYNPPLTIQELARLCGVSRQTVSAALGLAKRNNTRVSPATAKKIQEIAKQYRFLPNRSAQNLKSQYHESFGLLVSNFCRIALPTFVVMLNELKKVNKLLIVDSLSPDPPYSRFLMEHCIDALLTFDELPPEVTQLIDFHRFPIIHVNSNFRGQTNTISYNETQAIELAVSYLLQNGRRYPLLLQRKSDHYSASERVNAYSQLYKRGLFYNHHVLLPKSDHFEQELIEYLGSHEEIDSIIVGSVDVSSLYYTLHSLNKRIPEDIVVVSFIWPAQEPRVRPFPAGLLINQNILGETIVKLLLMTYTNPTPPSYIIDYYLQPGDLF